MAEPMTVSPSSVRIFMVFSLSCDDVMQDARAARPRRITDWPEARTSLPDPSSFAFCLSLALRPRLRGILRPCLARRRDGSLIERCRTLRGSRAELPVSFDRLDDAAQHRDPRMTPVVR